MYGIATILRTLYLGILTQVVRNAGISICHIVNVSIRKKYGQHRLTVQASAFHACSCKPSVRATVPVRGS